MSRRVPNVSSSRRTQPHRRPRCDRLTEFLYDILQHAVGAGAIIRRLEPHLAGCAGQRVLDVGAGTGIYATALPDGAQHIWLDQDPAKLHRFRAKFPQHRRALLGDAAALGLAPGAVHASMCMNVVHHLSDEMVVRFLGELARVTRGPIVIEDPLDTPAFASRALWAIDRGSHPRTVSRLLELISSVLQVVSVEEFRVLHAYVLVVARRKEQEEGR